MPFPVQSRRFAAALTRFLGLQGFLGLTIVEDLQPVIEVGLRGDPSVDFLRGDRRRGSARLAAAVAGQFSFVRLANLSDNHLLLVEQSILVHAGGGVAHLQVGLETLGGAGGATSATSNPIDTRQEQPTITYQAGAGILTTGSNAAVVATAPFFIGPSAVIPMTLRVVLGPHSALVAEAQLANTALTASLQWIERPLLEVERTSG